MSVHNIFPNNSNYTNHIHISQAGIDCCNSKLTKNVQFEKYIH